jgi:nitroreductase
MFYNVNNQEKGYIHMEFDEVITRRRSIRNFTPAPLPEGTLEKLLEAARLAPSGLNLQPWRFAAIEDDTARKQIAEATPSSFIAQAPLLILCCMDTRTFDSVGERLKELNKAGVFTIVSPDRPDEIENLPEDYKRESLVFSTALSIEHIILKATDLGLGSLIVGAFDAAKIKEAVGLPETVDILSIVAIGYAVKEPAPRPRLPLDSLLLKRCDMPLRYDKG